MNDKMIEEMASDMNFACVELSKEQRLEIARVLINLDYRKILEGSVVLDRQEHQHYCAYKIIEPQIKGCLDRERELERKLKELEEQRDKQAYITEELIQEKHRWTEQARKETAKEIFETLYEEFGLEEIGKNSRIKVTKFGFLNVFRKILSKEVEE